MIGVPSDTDERITLITELFSDRLEIEAAGCLSEDDAQSFVNVVDEVFLHSFTSEDSTDLNLNSPSRCWIA